MNRISNDLEVNHTFVGLSDVPALQAEVVLLQSSLDDKVRQLRFERDCLEMIETARGAAIIGSSALQLVFDKDNVVLSSRQLDRSYSTQQRLDAAFGRLVGENVYRFDIENISALTSDLRRRAHPDKGGDADVAKAVGGGLEMIDIDPNAVIVEAISITSSIGDDVESLRDERYRLKVALTAADPLFETEADARKTTEARIGGVEWSVRATAASLTLRLILGAKDDWSDFLQSIVASQNNSMIALVNTVIPEIMSIQERISKGEPKKVGEFDQQEVDAILELIWQRRASANKSGLPYSPPYQNWLEVLLPAMRELDPGERPGETYVSFGKPIRPVHYMPKNAESHGCFEKKGEYSSIYLKNIINIDDDKYYNNKNY